MARPLEKDPEFPIWLEGVEEGKRQGRKEVLDFFEEKYLNPKLDTTTVEAQAILKLTRESSEWIRQQNKVKAK